MSLIAVVTGSTRGLGLATARLLGQHGFHVVVTGRNRSAAEHIAEQYVAQDISAEGLALDVTSAESVRCAAVEIDRRHGRLDVLINNAGILPEATAGDSADFAHPAAVAETLRTNTIGPVMVIEAFLPLLRRSEAGRVVNVSTTMGSLQGQTDPASPYYSMIVPGYQASKAALNSITIGLAKHLADTPITVTSVCPGFVRTELTPMNRDHAPTETDDAAAVVVRAAIARSDEPSGTFVDASGPVPW